MRYLASRVAIVGSLLFLILWIASSLLRTAALGTGNFGLAATLARPAWTIDLPLFGFLGLMIFGLATHFMPLFAGRALSSPRIASVAVVLAIGSVALSLGVPRLLFQGRVLWLAASGLFGALIVTSLRSGTASPRPGSRIEGLEVVDRRAGLITRAAVVYLVIASIAFVVVSPGGRAILPALAPYGSSVLHLFVFGFVALGLIGLTFHLLTRFLSVVPSARGIEMTGILGVLSPVGVALTIPSASTSSLLRSVFLGFVLVQASGAVLFALIVVRMARRAERERPAAAFFVVGGFWLILGVGLGAIIAVAQGTALRSASTHDWLLSMGFEGFAVFGITHEILPPYARQGLLAWRLAARGHEVLATLGVALVAVSQALALAGYPRSSSAFGVAGFVLLLGMALSYAAGTFLTLGAISPPPELARSTG